MVALQNLALFGLRRVGDANLEQKAVELRLGQRVGALEVDRVLRGEDGEPGGQRAARAVARMVA